MGRGGREGVVSDRFPPECWWKYVFLPAGFFSIWFYKEIVYLSKGLEIWLFSEDLFIWRLFEVDSVKMSLLFSDRFLNSSRI